jgi:hypothetical protein
LGIQQWWLSTASRPTITQSEEIPFLTLNMGFGRFTWESIDVTFRDPIGPSATQAMEWVRLHSESLLVVKVMLLVIKDLLNLKCLTLLVWLEMVIRWNYVNIAAFGDLSMDDDGIADNCNIKI